MADLTATLPLALLLGPPAALLWLALDVAALTGLLLWRRCGTRDTARAHR